MIERFRGAAISVLLTTLPPTSQVQKGAHPPIAAQAPLCAERRAPDPLTHWWAGGADLCANHPFAGEPDRSLDREPARTRQTPPLRPASRQPKRERRSGRHGNRRRREAAHAGATEGRAPDSWQVHADAVQHQGEPDAIDRRHAQR